MPSAPSASSQDARIVAGHGQRYLCETADGAVIPCLAPSRREIMVCGDRVRLARGGASDAVIVSLYPRTSLVYRSDQKREKPIAANVGRVAIVVAVSPQPNSELIDRCLAAAEYAEIEALLVLNKIDLESGRDCAHALIERYRQLGYGSIEMCAHGDIAPLLALLSGRWSLLLGQSGVGKSTLINALFATTRARTAQLSRSDSGRHTTTRAYAYRIDENTVVVDSPGMHAFGVGHIPPSELAQCFVEFRPYLGACRFNDCRHLGDPGCALRGAVSKGEIRVERMQAYERILRSLSSLQRNG